MDEAAWKTVQRAIVKSEELWLQSDNEFLENRPSLSKITVNGRVLEIKDGTIRPRLD